MTRRLFHAAAIAAALSFGGGFACQSSSSSQQAGAGGSGQAGRPHKVSHGASQGGTGGFGYRGEDTALAAGNSSGGPVGGNTTIREPAGEGDRQANSGGSGSLGMAGIVVPPDLTWSGFGSSGQEGSVTAPAPKGQMRPANPQQ